MCATITWTPTKTVLLDKTACVCVVFKILELGFTKSDHGSTRSEPAFKNSELVAVMCLRAMGINIRHILSTHATENIFCSSLIACTI